MITFKIKQFFDIRKVRDPVARASYRILSQFGAFVRAAAQRSMLGHAVPKGFGMKSSVTNREGVSHPGQAPLPHNGLLVKGIEFFYDPVKMSVIIGPALLSAKGRAVGKTVPQVLEEGGQTIVAFKHRPAEVRPVASRPYMKPAFDQERPKLAGKWANSVKG